MKLSVIILISRQWAWLTNNLAPKAIIWREMGDASLKWRHKIMCVRKHVTFASFRRPFSASDIELFFISVGEKHSNLLGNSNQSVHSYISGKFQKCCFFPGTRSKGNSSRPHPLQPFYAISGAPNAFVWSKRLIYKSAESLCHVRYALRRWQWEDRPCRSSFFSESFARASAIVHCTWNIK